MKEGQPSFTAIGSAMMRAGHVLFDGTPKILQDDLALGLSGFENEAALARALGELHHNEEQRSTPEFAQFLFRSLRAIMAVRNRYAEDELRSARQRSVTQYVLLGAGLDSFAYSRQDWPEGLHVFEIDYPSSQQWKRTRLRELQVGLPTNLTFVPIDFEHQTLREALAVGGYRMEAPAFFSWLGVTQYLTPAVTLGTLQEIASFAPGSEIVFEYTVPVEQLEGAERQYVRWCQTLAAERGEPWLGFFDPIQLVTHLRGLGFTEVTELSPAEINARYFMNRSDGLQTPQAHHLMKARVGEIRKANAEDKNAS